jgi:uncharacterized protein (TIGR03437 family)
MRSSLLCLLLSSSQFAAAQLNTLTAVNSATYESGAPLAPQTLASAFGSFSGVSTQQAMVSPLPTMLGGVQVLIRNTPAPLLYVSSSQINFVVPRVEIADGNAEVTVRVNGNVAGTAPVALVESQPYLFLESRSAANPALAVNATGAANAESARAAPGSVVGLYVTGLGAQVETQTLGAMIGLQHVTDLTAQNVGPAIWRILVRLPASGLPSGQTPVAIHAGATASNTASLWTQ